MTIAIICGETLQGVKEYDWLTLSTKEILLKLDPSLNIEIWPTISDKNQVDCVLVWNYKPGILLDFTNLKAIFSLGAGVDHILSDSMLPNNIQITRIVDPKMAGDMAQYAATAVLNWVRRMPHWLELQKKNDWSKQQPFSLSDKVVGVLGLGFLGQKTAQTIESLGLKTIGWSRNEKKLAKVKCYSGNDELKTFQQQADIVICLLPLTKATENLLNKDFFNALPDQAYIINMARGKLLVDNDLLAGLESGKLAGACLDVFRQEPLPKQHPFWSHPKIIVTPHISACTTPETVASQIVENYHRLLQHQPLKNTVDVVRGY